MKFIHWIILNPYYLEIQILVIETWMQIFEWYVWSTSQWRLLHSVCRKGYQQKIFWLFFHLICPEMTKLKISWDYGPECAQAWYRNHISNGYIVIKGWQGTKFHLGQETVDPKWQQRLIEQMIRNCCPRI